MEGKSSEPQRYGGGKETTPHTHTHSPSACRGTAPWFPMSILSFVILLQKRNVNVTHGFCSKLQRSNKELVKNTGQANALSIRLHCILCKFIIMPIHIITWQSDSPTCVELIVVSHLFFSPYIFCFLVTLRCPEKGANVIPWSHILPNLSLSLLIKSHMLHCYSFSCKCNQSMKT